LEFKIDNMNLQVLLSEMNIKKDDLTNMNITGKCVVINQCDRNAYEKFGNFDIYSYAERGAANSRNRGLEHITEEIIILCDDDVVYDDGYEEKILEEFERNKNADIIVFNLNSPNRKIKQNTKEKRLHFYNILRYSSPRIAFRRESIEKNNISFNKLFGPGAKYTSGEDTLFLVDSLKNKLKIYSSTKNLGTMYHEKSTWFNGYTEEYFFNKGALFTALGGKLRFILFIQFLLRHNEIIKKVPFFIAFKYMINGSNDYIKTKKLYEKTGGYKTI